MQGLLQRGEIMDKYLKAADLIQKAKRQLS